MHEAERQRLLQLNRFEDECKKKGYQHVAGIDEAGRGPLAGPVVAAACILLNNALIEGVDDSKKLTPKKRNQIIEKIRHHPDVVFSVGLSTVEEIDKINILRATILAMKRAILSLPFTPDYLLVDGMDFPYLDFPFQKIIKGDALSQSIGLASIIAKEFRDALMLDYHAQWPEYEFASHRGYGTKKHLEALKKFGPSPTHRLTFAPCR